MSTHFAGNKRDTPSGSSAVSTRMYEIVTLSVPNNTINPRHLVVAGQKITGAYIYAKAVASSEGEIFSTVTAAAYVTDESTNIAGARVGSKFTFQTQSTTSAWLYVALDIDLSSYVGQYIKPAGGYSTNVRIHYETVPTGDARSVDADCPTPLNTISTRLNAPYLYLVIEDVSAQTIVSVNGGAGITPNAAVNGVLNGFTDTPNAATFGGKALTSFSYTAPNFSAVMPDYQEGVSYPTLGASSNVLVSSTGAQTATLAVPLNLKPDYSLVSLASAISDDDTYFSYWLNLNGVSISDGTKITWPTTTGFSFNADGGVTSTIARTITAWIQDVTDNFMYEYNVTVNDASEVVSAGIVRDIKKTNVRAIVRNIIH